jgi:predicted nucleic acid-binding protein
MLVVADTSSLVALAAAGSLNLLDRLFQEVRVPTAVETELLIPGKPPFADLQEFLRGKVLTVDLTRYVIAAPGLGAGELEAMALYKALSADQLLVDDDRPKGRAPQLHPSRRQHWRAPARQGRRFDSGDQAAH